MVLVKLSEESQKTKEKPAYLDGKIVLGEQTTTRRFHHREDLKPSQKADVLGADYNRIGVYSYMAGQSSGKTVLLKRQYQQIHDLDPQRPIIVFDMQGTDHKETLEASTKGRVAPWEQRWGYHGDKPRRLDHLSMQSLTPRHLVDEDPVNRDEYFHVSHRELTPNELRFVMDSKSVSAETALQFYQDHKHKGLSEIMGAASADIDMDDGRLSSKSFQYLKSFVESLQNNGFKDRPGIELSEVVKPGTLTVLNFHSDDTLITQVVIGNLIRRLYNRYKDLRAEGIQEGKRPNTPAVVIEESNFLLSSQSGVATEPGKVWATNLITKAQKYGFYVVLVMQDAHDITAKTRRVLFGNNLFVCNPTAKDKKALKQYVGKDVVNRLDDLDWPLRGAKEWLFKRNRVVHTFKPYASPGYFDDRYADNTVEDDLL